MNAAPSRTSLRPVVVIPLVLTALAAIVLAFLPPTRASADEDVPAYATERWDRIAEGLRKDALFVDPDLADAVTGPMRVALRERMDAAGESLQTTVYFIAVPVSRESEVKGDAGLLLDGVRERLGENGLYLLADEDGHLAAEDYGIPREFPYEIVPWRLRDEVDYEDPFGNLVSRVGTVLDKAVTAPPGEPSRPDASASVPSFVEEADDHARPKAAIWGPFFAGLLLFGPLLVLLFWALWGAFRVMRAASRSPRQNVRNLHATAAKELRVLSQGLETAGDGPGTAAALRAYDAALLLVDEARGAADKAAAALDLVGVIVLCRQGGIALAEDLARGPSFCQVNPLHGIAVRTVKRTDRGHPQGRVCRDCAGRSKAQIASVVLRVPDRRPYFEVEGRWREGFDGRPDLAARVLESLGVH
ncbi:hypothetical protein [Actinocorallia sp. A-T 12471]|uniref:hypothetical protein n=1 Tax=Actinocorallia sp. A-T 12471 TaxID=3089813 RepID=UPI0029CF737E|nr:hypothetical protein [Actinocorallia sp. A-T 12471]MDX6738725.1 hypothetical protein [Actinocorallia sp. A-T 12471]